MKLHKGVRCAQPTLQTSALGQKAKYSLRADAFRYSPDIRHSARAASRLAEGVPPHLAVPHVARCVRSTKLLSPLSSPNRDRTLLASMRRSRSRLQTVAPSRPTSTLDSGYDDSFATVERPAEQRGVRWEDYFQGAATDRPAGLLLSLAVHDPAAGRCLRPSARRIRDLTNIARPARHDSCRY
jgi:hypothetical protein